MRKVWENFPWWDLKLRIACMNNDAREAYDMPWNSCLARGFPMAKKQETPPTCLPYWSDPASALHIRRESFVLFLYFWKQKIVKLEVEIKSYNRCLQIIFGSSSCLLASKLVFFLSFFLSFLSFLPCLALPSLVQQICMSGGLAISIAASHSRLRRRRHPQIFCQQPWLPPRAPPSLLLSSFIHPPTSTKPPFIIHPLATNI